jgi:hypothetical protein
MSVPGRWVDLDTVPEAGDGAFGNVNPITDYAPST